MQCSLNKENNVSIPQCNPSKLCCMLLLKLPAACIHIQLTTLQPELDIFNQASWMPACPLQFQPPHGKACMQEIACIKSRYFESKHWWHFFIATPVVPATAMHCKSSLTCLSAAVPKHCCKPTGKGSHKPARNCVKMRSPEASALGTYYPPGYMLIVPRHQRLTHTCSALSRQDEA